MIKLNFKKIDAFTKGKSSGNPAGYVLLEENQQLNEVQMQKMAVQLKGFVNEVGFVSQYEDGYSLKFYSSECEVEFCGHATIAIMYDLIATNEQLMQVKEIPIYVNAGKLIAFNHVEESDAVYIMAPDEERLTHDLMANAIASALEVEESEIRSDLPIQLIDGGLRTLIVPIKTLDNCLSINPNEAALKKFCLRNEIDIILVFCEETQNGSADYRTRVFAPKFGYFEDPATGSGNSAFGYYLKGLNKSFDNLLIEQSSNRENPNYVKLKSLNLNKSFKILFGGCATTRIDGLYHLHE